MKVIYIMGAGHIGSTILDLVLSSHPQFESLGEVSKFHNYGWLPDDNRNCACGLAVYDCQFWSQVRKNWSEITGSVEAKRYMELQPRFERTRSAWRRLIRNRINRTPEFNEYLQGTEAMYQAIQQAGGKDYLVDSSLTPKRAYAQTMNPNIDLYLIHLVRDGRGVIWSLMKPNKKIPAKVYIPAPPHRTTKYWISANMQSAFVFRNVEKKKRKLIRYEDFAMNPSAVMTQIGELIGEDLSGLIKDTRLTNTNQVRHTVGGNRVRFQKDEDIRIRPDFAWMENLSEKDRRLFWRRAGWLARRFGYIQHQVDYL